jgi:hypothetical protein
VGGGLNGGERLSAGLLNRQKRNYVTPNLEPWNAKNGRYQTLDKSLTGPRIFHYLWSYVIERLTHSTYIINVIGSILDEMRG